MADFDIGVRRLARFDAVEPVLNMRPGDPAVAFPLISCTAGSGASSRSRAGWSRSLLRLISILQSVPMKTAPPIGPSLRSKSNRRAVGVLHRDDATSDHLARARSGRCRLCRGPLDLIDAVGAPVGHFAAGVIAPLHPGELQRFVEGRGAWSARTKCSSHRPLALALRAILRIGLELV